MGIEIIDNKKLVDQVIAELPEYKIPGKFRMLLGKDPTPEERAYYHLKKKRKWETKPCELVVTEDGYVYINLPYGDLILIDYDSNYAIPDICPPSEINLPPEAIPDGYMPPESEC